MSNASYHNLIFRNLRFACLFLLTIIMSTGCTMFIPMSPKMGELVLMKPVPIEVALLVTEKDHNYIYRGHPSSFAGSAGTLEFPLGQALETVSMDAFSQVFQKVILVRTLSDAQHYRAYIKSSVEAFDFRVEPSSDTPLVVKSSLRVALMHSNGIIWDKVESNQTRTYIPGSLEKQWGEAANENMLDSMKKIATAMSEDPVIRRLGASK